VAAADRVAEPTALEPEPAAAAGGRQEPGLDEERPHQGAPEEDEAEDEGTLHPLVIGRWPTWDKIPIVSWLYIALLAAAVAVVVAAEWPRLERRFGSRVSGEARRRRQRERRKASLRVVQTTEQDDFAASVERDLANLPTTEETDRRY
jgi:hypothetical protein